MDFLLEALTNWLKEMLVGGIMSNLSGMFDLSLIHIYRCVRSAEGLYQRSADTGELHSPTGIAFPTPCVLHARRYPALQSIICHEV